MPEHVLCPSSMRLLGAPVVLRRKALLLLPPQQPKVIPWGDDPEPCQRYSDSVTTTVGSTGRRYGDVALALAAAVLMVLGTSGVSAGDNPPDPLGWLLLVTAAAIRVPRRLASICPFSHVPRHRCGTESQVKSQPAAAGGVHNR
jgi:hypothetical protein